MMLELMRSGTFWFKYRTPGGSGKYIRFGLSIETGAERTTIIVDIFDIIQHQQLRDTGVHLKVDEEGNFFLDLLLDTLKLSNI